MRHAEQISFTPRLPPRLMICSSAGISDSPPSRPKRLVPVYLTSRNFSKPSASTSLLRMARLPSHGEADFLVAAFDALLDPAFLRGIGDVHELDAQRLAIGAAQDGDDLAHGREFEPEHLVEENPAVEIGFGEAVGARIEFFFVLFRLEPERIELGVEMAAHAVGADQHQRVDGIARGLLHVGRGNLDALALRLGGDFFADALFGFRPLPVERGHQIAVRPQRPIRFLPGGAARAFDDVGARRPSGSRKTPAIRHRPRRGRSRIWRRGLRCRRRCRRRGRRCGRRLHWRPGGTWFDPCAA